MAIEISVQGKPPYKQAPASPGEKGNQDKSKEELQNKAREMYKSEPLEGDVSLVIVYSRSRGKMDSANIIGGIADALENIVYKNDRQIKSIQYTETKGGEDHYTVSVITNREQ